MSDVFLKVSSGKNEGNSDMIKWPYMDSWNTGMDRDEKHDN